MTGNRCFSKRHKVTTFPFHSHSFLSVVFDEVPSNNPRYPTDHWAGYGLSYSLPSDLLKVSPYDGRNNRV